jgi:threonyl-tRNA synthetase
MLGSVERMMAVLIEHFQGKWPFWLSPRQVLVVPVHQDHYPYAEEVAKVLYANGFYADADLGPNTMNKKVREGQLKMYNFILVVGGEEVEKRGVNIRTRINKPTAWTKGFLPLDECIAFFKEIAANYERDPVPEA